MSTFTATRDVAVALARAALTIPLDAIDEAIQEADQSLAIAPVIDPTLFLNANDELRKQIRLLKATRTFRAEIEKLRPDEEPHVSAGEP